MAELDLRVGFLASYHTLTKRLDADSLLPHLVSGGLISPEEKDAITGGRPSGSEKTDRLLTLLHRRGKGDPSVFKRWYELLSDESVNSGQLLGDVLGQIEKDARDPEVKARFEPRPGPQVVPGLTSVEVSVAESLSVDEFLAQFISLGILTIDDNERIRSKSTRTDQAREMIKCIKHKGSSAYDGFVEALLASELQSALGERLKNEKNVPNVGLQVLQSQNFRGFLSDCEDSVNRTFAEIARTIYKMGYEEGMAAALQSRTKTVGFASGPPPPILASDTSSSSVTIEIAEKVKAVSDKFPAEIKQETKSLLVKLFQDTSVFMVTRESVRVTCARVLLKYPDLFQSGWHQVSFVYYVMFQVVVMIKEESGDESTDSKEEQIANFVFPTLVDLGLYKWMEKHGGMDKFDSPVSGDDAKVLIEESCLDPET